MTGRAAGRPTALMRQLQVFFALGSIDLALLVTLIYCLVCRSS